MAARRIPGAFRITHLYGPDTRPAHVSTSRTYFDIRCTGRRPRRPTVIRIDSKFQGNFVQRFRRGRPPGRPMYRIPDAPSPKKVAAPPRIIFVGRLERRPLQGCTVDFREFVGRRGRRPVRRLKKVFREFGGAACGPSGSLAPTGIDAALKVSTR